MRCCTGRHYTRRMAEIRLFENPGTVSYPDCYCTDEESEMEYLAEELPAPGSIRHLGVTYKLLRRPQKTKGTDLSAFEKYFKALERARCSLYKDGAFQDQSLRICIKKQKSSIFAKSRCSGVSECLAGQNIKVGENIRTILI